MPDRPPPGGVAFHEAGRSCGHSGHFASEVEFSKGYRYFASVITLAKCGSAAKVGIRRVGIAVKTAHGARLPDPGARRPRGIAARTGPAPPLLSNETHWGRKPPIGVGNLPTPMPSCLPQCGKARHVAYPNALLPTPMREGAPRCLPQCTVTYPNAGARPPAALSAPRLLRAPLRIWAGVVRNASGFRCFRWAPRGSGPKCVWVSLFSAGSARGWSEMRLGLTVLAGSGWIRPDSDAFWTTCPSSPRSRPRLRRILDHRTAGAPGH